MKLNLKRQWETAQTALQRFNTDLLRDIDKLNEFEIALNNNMTTKALVDRYNKLERPVKNKEGKSITEIQEQRNRWVEYFEELLNRSALSNLPEIEAAQTDIPIAVTPPTIKEIRITITQINSGKAAEPDNIPAEALNSDIQVTSNMLHTLFRKIRQEEQVPSDRLERRIPHQDIKERRSERM
ncbi:unnamed protein product [Schistosoma mattheei]|uniref:Uncharacterized protein n=1 Tax=Schistosoma mattheei TaxID=31246 RepID=A0A183NF50_9TREM|nr:unnamed protein product [Schistosoma mattheei]